eukprot:TRINITY_DN40787_c0_g1_i1.p1 TRINITY_DN40787_c0_g1~~TRINITY_DN40787_c0_g1_i1.p1  ORF type:complete len:378 (-),score=139.88 TRINITY_DN40787_c0_g1_i1:84-1217(-)
MGALLSKIKKILGKKEKKSDSQLQESQESTAPSSSSPQTTQRKKKVAPVCPVPHAENEDVICIQRKHVGVVIGPKGANIKDAQEKSKASINVKEDETDSDEKNVWITGSDEERKVARILIGQKVEEFTNGPLIERFELVTRDVVVDKEYQSLVVGKGGSTIKEIRESVPGLDIEMPKGDDNPIVVIGTEEMCDIGEEMILNVVQKVSSNVEGRNELFEKTQAEVSRLAKLRQEKFSAANKAFAEGDKEKAKQLSEEGNKLSGDIEEARLHSAEVVFDHVNKDRKVLPTEDGETIDIDLHGLQVDQAVAITLKRASLMMDEMKSKGFKTIVYKVITGRGSHSAGGVALIRPRIKEELEVIAPPVDDSDVGAMIVTLKA